MKYEYAHENKLYVTSDYIQSSPNSMGVKLLILKKCLSNFNHLIYAFTWKDSPQGEEFWRMTYHGVATRKEEEEAVRLITLAIKDIEGPLIKISLEEAMKEVI